MRMDMVARPSDICEGDAMRVNIEKLLKSATKGIAAEWFSITNLEENNQLKERVYCYELYHQLRCLPLGKKLVWQAELVKRRGRRSNFSGEIPDFLLHEPGVNDKNYLVMEVKRCDNLASKKQEIKQKQKQEQEQEQKKYKLEGLAKDLQTLSKFLERNAYKYAFLLIFGASSETESESVILSKLKEAKKLAVEMGCDKTRINEINVLWHKAHGQAAEKIGGPWR